MSDQQHKLRDLWVGLAVALIIGGPGLSLTIWAVEHGVAHVGFWPHAGEVAGLALVVIGIVLGVAVGRGWWLPGGFESKLAAKEHSSVASPSVPAIADAAPDPNWVARCDDTSPDVLLFILEHKEDPVATAGFKYLRCEVIAPDKELRRAEGQHIGQAGNLRIARYPESFDPESVPDIPRARNGLYEFKWFGRKDGAWRFLAGDVHEVTGRPAVRDTLLPGERLPAKPFAQMGLTAP